MSDKIEAETQRLSAVFQDAGATPVAPNVLLPAGTLLDLYGEDIRARAYVTPDPLHGEVMLRPDFTVPVVQQHMQSGADPARYTYAGKVFRKQEQDPSRKAEFVQVGFEVFDGTNPAKSDADVFATILKALDGADVRIATGDIGLLTAAVQSLRTSSARKAALLRHIWRPARFRKLLDRFAGKDPVPPARAALIASQAPFEHAGDAVGLRSKAEIEARIAALKADAQEPPLSTEDCQIIDTILTLDTKLPDVIPILKGIAADRPEIGAALDRLSSRTSALANNGIDVSDLPFEGSYGRTSMEYYDGFVFGFHPHTGGAPVATGGRYDALTARLGQGVSAPAIGGVVRPDLLLHLREGTTC